MSEQEKDDRKRADDEDIDVEGHGMHRSPDGATRRDTEGVTRREGEGISHRVAGDDDDVEGHSFMRGLSGSSGRGE